MIMKGNWYSNEIMWERQLVFRTEGAILSFKPERWLYWYDSCTLLPVPRLKKVRRYYV